MLFTSRSFAVLVLITFGLFYLPQLKRYQTQILILASFVFYSLNQILYLPLLLFSITFNALASQAIYFHKDAKTGRRLAIIGVVVNLLLLGFFKYSGLLGRSLPASWVAGANPAHYLLMVSLPVGISFFTFEGISLVVDTYKARNAESFFGTDFGKTRGAHLLSTTLFISFFPHLVAGPILKAYDFYPQIKTKHFGEVNWELCFRKLVTGYFLKMVVADGLKEYTIWMTYPYFQNIPGVELATMIFAFSMQIFADFAGYSLIAIGVAALFGYRFPENFDFPYISRSFSEFWRRWHISLSSWLREYLYFPLGGNRKGAVRTYVNLFIVMFLGGLWHGAAWSYAIWGSIHGLALAIERFFVSRPRDTNVTRHESVLADALRMLLVFTVVTAAWLPFKFPIFWHAAVYVKCMVRNPWNIGFPPHVFSMLVLCVPVIVYHAQYLARLRAWGGVRDRAIALIRPIAYGVMLFLLVTNSANSGDFIYFQF
jgi:alginate O-acetyltransferase complex protein AlgI